jgi:hypothetical protein
MRARPPVPELRVCAREHEPGFEPERRQDDVQERQAQRGAIGLLARELAFTAAHQQQRADRGHEALARVVLDAGRALLGGGAAHERLRLVPALLLDRRERQVREREPVGGREAPGPAVLGLLQPDPRTADVVGQQRAEAQEQQRDRPHGAVRSEALERRLAVGHELRRALVAEGGAQRQAHPLERGAVGQEARPVAAEGHRGAVRGVRRFAALVGRPPAPERRLRVGRELLLGEPRTPAPDRRRTPVGDVVADVRGDQVAGDIEVPRVDRVPDRPIHVAGLGVRRAGATMQPALARRVPGVQLGAQHLPEQAVDAEDLAMGLDGSDEEVGVGECLQAHGGVLAAQHSVADHRPQLVKDRRAHEKPGVLGCGPGQHLLAEVLREVRLVGAERDSRAQLGLRAQHEARQPDRGRPALGALDDDRRLAVVDVHARRAQHRGALSRRHAQVGGLELPQAPLCAQPRERERRSRAPRQDDGAAGRRLLAERVQHVHGAAAVQEVDVVEDEHQRLDALVEQRDEPRERQRQHAGPARRQARDQLLVGSAVPSQRMREVEQQHDRVVVALVEREPRHRAGLVGGELAEQRRLPVARRRADHPHRGVGRGGQAPDQPRARDGFLPVARWRQPPGERRRRNGSAGRRLGHGKSLARGITPTGRGGAPPPAVHWSRPTL